MRWRVGRLFAAVLTAWLVLSGCGQSFISSSGSPGDDGRGEQGGQGPNVERNYMLVPAGAKEPTVPVRDSHPLKVFLFDKESGDPISDEPVDYAVTDGEDTVSLSSQTALTGDEGASKVDLRTGARAGDVVIEVDHKAADAIEFHVTVEAVPTGKLRIRTVNTATSVMRLTDVKLRLYDGDSYSCSEFQPLAQNIRKGKTTKFVDRAGNSVEFGPLKTTEEFVVTGVARGDRGQIAGGGCKENISVPADDIAQKELLLHLVPLNPTGRYQVTSEWDFSKALADSGVVGKNIVRVLNIFDNPGQAIYSEVLGLVKNLVGGLVSRGIELFLNKTGLDDKIKNTINSAVQNNEALCKVREAGRDVRDVVTNLTIHSELVIGQLQSNYAFQGRDNWLGITLYWRGRCKDAYEDACSGNTDDNSVDARKKPCAAMHLTADGKGKLGKLGILSATWKGRVTSYNQLRIERHPLPLKYGRLIQFVVNDIVVPELTDGNANSLSEAFGYWLGCGDLATGITGSDGEICALGACIKDDDIEGFCSTAVSTLFGAADLLLGNLEYDTGVVVGGEARLVETNSDGRVDYIEEGIWDGYIEVNGSGSGMSGGRSEVSGTWNGERLRQPGAN